MRLVEYYQIVCISTSFYAGHKKEGLQSCVITVTTQALQPLKIYLHFNFHAVPECERQLAVRSHGCFLDHQPPELFIELVNHHVSFFKF